VSAHSHAEAPAARAHDWLLLSLLVVLWGSAFGLTEIALRGFSPIQVVTVRLWIGALVLVVLMVMSAEPIPRDGRSWAYLLAMSVLGNVLPFFLISWGQQTISSALTGILMAVMPLVVLVLAHFLVPGERLNGPKVSGFLLGFAGVVLLIGPSALAGLGGDAAEVVAQLSVLGGAVCYGLNLIIARRAPRLSVLLTAGCVLLISALLSSVAAFAAGDPLPTGLSTAPTVALMCLGLLSTGLATIVFGFSRSFPLSIAAYMIVGMADQISVVMRGTAIQLSTPDALRGRVSSVNMIFIGASNQLGAVESGFVAALTSATFAVVSGGVGCLIVLAVVALKLPELRRYRV